MQIENAQQAHEAITRRMHAVISKPEVPDALLHRIQERSESWRHLLGTMGREGKLDRVEWKVLLGSWSVWQTSVEHLVDALSWIAGRHESKVALEKLAEPAEVFSRYAHDVAKRVAGSSDAVERSAGAGALAIATEQMTKSTALANEAMAGRTLEAGKEAERTGPSLAETSPQSLVFYAQEKELAAHGENLGTKEGGELAELSPSAQWAAIAHEIGELVCRCNRVRKAQKREEIFKPTTTLLQAISCLPFVVVVDRVSMGTFADYLYFILYEDAGAMQPRYLREYGGAVDPNESVLDVVRAAKALRNKLRHDPDHGSDADIARSWRTMANNLEAIRINGWPATANDFAHLQDTFLQRTRAFLNELLARLDAEKEGSALAS